MKELILEISNRKIVNMAAFKEMMKDLKDGRHLITVKDFRKRSLPQNAYYWGVIVPMVRRGLFDNGFDEVTMNDEAHTIIKQVILGKNMVSKVTGDMISISGSTAKLTIPEFNEFIEKICKWSAEYLGVVIPSPDEEYALFSDEVRYYENEAKI